MIEALVRFVAGALWDGRWHVPPALAGMLPEGAMIGAAGEGGGPGGRHLPAVIRRGLPALFLGGEALPWPPPGPVFAPASGPVL